MKIGIKDRIEVEDFRNYLWNQHLRILAILKKKSI